MLTAISPIDGRYASKVENLSKYFSEYALFKYRVIVEIKYFIDLSKVVDGIEITEDQLNGLQYMIDNFSTSDAEKIKKIEKVTNHDVKATEYFIKEAFDNLGLSQSKEWVHFGLTSQDVNNTSVPLSLKDFLTESYYPMIDQVILDLSKMAKDYSNVPMLARTHGQPASPTVMGKEMRVFLERIDDQLNILKALPIKAKFGGATGNLNAHKVSFPDIDWIQFANSFVQNSLGISRSHYTTQIAHYDHLAAIFDSIRRINVILLDFCRDMWTYISMEYFLQKIVANEVGSSAMPHKVNPIDFENAEGNLGIANAILDHLSNKLPISRLQRDLTDSTVLRNLGVPCAHTIIAFQSIIKGMKKLLINEAKIAQDLDNNWAVVAEAIQNILRRENYPSPYEKLKELTRNNQRITKDSIHSFIRSLDVSDDIQDELLQITPFNYIGYA